MERDYSVSPLEIRPEDCDTPEDVHKIFEKAKVPTASLLSNLGLRVINLAPLLVLSVLKPSVAKAIIQTEGESFLLKKVFLET